MNNIKAILIDADGLLLKKQRYFSDIFSEQYGVPTELIIPFFKTKFRDCQRGVLNIKEVLPPFLEQWNWQGTVDDFLSYWFSECTQVDESALKIVRTLRSDGKKCYLATDQEKYRGEYIKKILGLENELDGFFYSYELECSKSEEKFFELILKQLALSPDEVLFFDDEEENVEVANRVGIQAVHIPDIKDFQI